MHFLSPLGCLPHSPPSTLISLTPTVTLISSSRPPDLDSFRQVGTSRCRRRPMSSVDLSPSLVRCCVSGDPTGVVPPLRKTSTCKRPVVVGEIPGIFEAPERCFICLMYGRNRVRSGGLGGGWWSSSIRATGRLSSLLSTLPDRQTNLHHVLVKIVLTCEVRHYQSPLFCGVLSRLSH